MIETVLSAAAIVAIVSVIIFYVYVKRAPGKDWVYAVCFITILFSGIMLYALGLTYANDKDTAFSPLFVLAKSIDLSLRSFGGTFSPSAVNPLAKENAVYMAALFVHFMFSVIMTALIALKLFGRNIVNKVRVYINSRRSKYIVAGAGAEAMIFLRNLGTAKGRRTTVVLSPKEKGKKKEMMEEGFSVVVVKDDVSKRGCKDELYRCVRDSLVTAGLNDAHDTVIVAMADDDEFNLLIARAVTDRISDIVRPVKNSAGRIADLTEEQEGLLKNINVTANIMYSSLDRTEHFAFTEYALGRVRFFNVSEARARKFILENPITSIVPEHWIDREKARLRGGGVRIGHIFVGFGDTNRQILRKSICDHQILGADYNALVIDRNAKELEGQFRNSAPGLFDRTENGKKIYGAELHADREYFEHPHEGYNISFANINVLSADFYQRVISELAGCDLVSVVIALGDDRLSIGTALELRQKLYERKLLKKDGHDRAKIYVRVFRDSVLSDRNVINDKNGIDSEIVIFGAADEILTERYIIQEDLDVIAKRIANGYWRTSADNAVRSNVVTKWDTLTEFKRQSNRYAAMAVRTKLNLLGFELCAGGTTDEDVIKGYNAAYGMNIADEQRRYMEESGKFVEYLERDPDGNIIDSARNNLAVLEHQRWVTLHLINGWTKLPKDDVTATVRQDQKTKEHACITTLDGLAELREMQAAAAVKNGGDMDKALRNADSVNYDFDVMDNLFKILDGTNFIVKRR